MIRLLRSIRKSLMADTTTDSDSKLRGYLLYAVGEIVLVVIGILIALQIGEWAERRNDEEALVAILRDIQDDLSADVAAADRALPAGAVMQSLADSILRGEFDRDDYLGSGWQEAGPGPVGEDARFDLFWVGMQYIPYTPTRNAFDRLSDFAGVVPASYRPLIERLTSHYVQQWEQLARREEIFIQQIEERHRVFSHEFPWYWKLRSGEWDEEMVDWHLNSDRRRGYLRRYQADQTLRPGSYVDEYRGSAIRTHLAISEFLGDPEASDGLAAGLRVSNAETLGPWLGAWRIDPEDIWTGDVSIVSDVLFIGRTPTVPENDSTFRLDFHGPAERVVFTRDSAGAPVIRSESADGSSAVVWVRPERR